MRKKILLSILVVLLLGLTITGFFSTEYIRSFCINETQKGLSTNGKIIAEAFKNVYNIRQTNYDTFAEKYSALLGARVTIIAANGRVMGESAKGSSSMENHSERPEVKRALSGDIGNSIRYSTTENIEMVYTAVPVNIYNSTLMVIRLSVPFVEVKKVQNYTVRYVLFAVLLSFAGTSIIAFTIVKNLTKPINEIKEISSQIAGGRYDKRISINTGDEIGEFADSFNNMAEKLEITINDLSDKRNKLEAILQSMQNGVIAVNNIGRIILANQAAIEMFGFQDNIDGKHILEVIRNAELEDIINKHQDQNQEISINYPQKRILRVKATPIKETSDSKKSYGVVVSMQDITELKNLEQMRSEFVANVSHELKTPLTSIKGFTETLKNGAINDPKARDKFLDIISVEADRLTRLINDILIISELENKKQNIVLEKININDSICQIEEIMKGLAKQKNINLIFDTGEDIPYVYANNDKVKQLLINLIDNAIKYTPSDGTVTVSTYYKYGNVYTEVCDTGIGISKEHLPRLFERFYRVDKGRSRALGGTGLGLAIVKHIVAAMNGNIEVESEPGKGSKFIVIIPEA